MNIVEIDDLNYLIAEHVSISAQKSYIVFFEACWMA